MYKKLGKWPLSENPRQIYLLCQSLDQVITAIQDSTFRKTRVQLTVKLHPLFPVKDSKGGAKHVQLHISTVAIARRVCEYFVDGWHFTNREQQKPRARGEFFSFFVFMFCLFGFQTQNIVWVINGIALRIAKKEIRGKTVNYLKKNDKISSIISMN